MCCSPQRVCRNPLCGPTARAHTALAGVLTTTTSAALIPGWRGRGAPLPMVPGSYLKPDLLAGAIRGISYLHVACPRPAAMRCHNVPLSGLPVRPCPTQPSHARCSCAACKALAANSLRSSRCTVHASLGCARPAGRRHPGTIPLAQLMCSMGTGQARRSCAGRARPANAHSLPAASLRGPSAVPATCMCVARAAPERCWAGSRMLWCTARKSRACVLDVPHRAGVALGKIGRV